MVYYMSIRVQLRLLPYPKLLSCLSAHVYGQAWTLIIWESLESHKFHLAEAGFGRRALKIAGKLSPNP